MRASSSAPTTSSPRRKCPTSSSRKLVQYVWSRSTKNCCASAICLARAILSSCSLKPCTRARASSRKPASSPRTTLFLPSSQEICAENTETVRVASSTEHPAEKNGGSALRISLYRRLSSASLNASSTVFWKKSPGVEMGLAGYLNVKVTVVFVCSLSTEHVKRGEAWNATGGRGVAGFTGGWPGAGAHPPNAPAISRTTASRSAKSPAAITATRSGRYHFS